MDAICAAASASCLVPSLSLVSTTFKKNQMPVSDTFGPFPDETICSALDRLLFYLGAKRIQKLLSLPSPTDDGEYHLTVEHAPSADEQKCVRICKTTNKEKPRSLSPLQKITVKKNCCCSKCKTRTNSCATQPSTISLKSKPCTSKTVNFSNIPTIFDLNEIPYKKKSSKATQALQRSFSMCSLACRKIKEKLFKQNVKCTCHSPKWLWTRMHCHADGSEIYEIYKYTDPCTHPTKLGKLTSNQPQKIFVSLPNGVTVPFQIVDSH